MPATVSEYRCSFVSGLSHLPYAVMAVVKPAVSVAQFARAM